VPFYAYQCPVHGEFTNQTCGDRSECPECGLEAKRRWVVNTGIVQHQYWNLSLGKPINGAKHFNSEMRRLEDKLSHRRGCDVNLEPADPSGPGVTDEGLKATHDANVKRGIAEPAPRIV
jgi:hypothetical protein